MTVFADSSALVKRYADEPGSDAVRAIGFAVASALARVEVPSALWRKHRLGELEARDAALLVRAFEADLRGDVPALTMVPASGAVLDRAAGLVAVHRLRAFDAVQLASAILTREADPSVSVFACFDRALSAAAAAYGFAVGPEADR